MFLSSELCLKEIIPQESEVEIVAEYVKEVGAIFFRDMPHIILN
jgi:hypothetical protein